MMKRKRAKGLRGVVNDTTYNDAADPKVVSLLESVRGDRSKRICILYGDTRTGKPWGDPPICGSIGRSTGTIKIPLLIKNRRSFGGEGLLEAHILEITESRKPRRVLYSHTRYRKW